jgi:hypothetical protein
MTKPLPLAVCERLEPDPHARPVSTIIPTAFLAPHIQEQLHGLEPGGEITIEGRTFFRPPVRRTKAPGIKSQNSASMLKPMGLVIGTHHPFDIQSTFAAFTKTFPPQ